MKINIENGESKIELVTPNQLSTGEMVGIFELVGAGKKRYAQRPNGQKRQFPLNRLHRLPMR